MVNPPVTIPISFVRGMLSGARVRERPLDPFLAAAQIAPELLQEHGARVTAEQYVTLFRTLIEQLDDEALGFLSRSLKRGSFALVARAAISATTLEVALRRAAHAFRLLQDDLVLMLDREQGLAGVTLRFIDTSRAEQIFLHELLLRVFWRLLAWLAGGQLPIERFDFAFESPPHAASYAKVFPAALRFGRPTSTFWFDAAHLQAPVRRDEAALRTFLVDAQANIIVPRRNDTVIARVRSHLQAAEPAWPDLGATALALHMSTSTLQRRLALEGTSFQALKDELRRDMAIVLLNTGTTPLTRLASQLGFADSAAFQRAFKSWTGSAPGIYRRRAT